jgi:hypothetical protein
MSWAYRQVRKAYPQFVSEFDRMRPQDVIWTPYTAAAIQTHTPHRLSSLCTRDEEYWLPKANLVFDILVKLQEYVEGWLDARDDMWDEGQPHTEASYGAYLRWYLSRTRPYVTLSRIGDAEHQHQPTISDTYPSYRDQAQHGAVRLSQLKLLNLFYKRLITILLCIPLRMKIDPINFAEVEATSQITLIERGVRVPEAQYKDSLRKIQDNLTRALRALTCRGRDDVGPPVHLMRPPTCTQLARRPLQHRTQRPAASSNRKSFIIAISITFDLHD